MIGIFAHRNPGLEVLSMVDKSRVEKFSMSELANLRCELMQAGIDSWQAADVVSAFLVGRGYGVDTASVRAAITRMDAYSGTPDTIQAVLETVAYVM
jgi:lipopolysaccharide biosynthesis regulator YciM